jgi:hypothetical protein
LAGIALKPATGVEVLTDILESSDEKERPDVSHQPFDLGGLNKNREIVPEYS